MVTYANGSCSTKDGFAGAFSGEIACANDRFARSVVVERAWTSVTGPKEVMNDSEVSCSSWLRSCESKSITKALMALSVSLSLVPL